MFEYCSFLHILSHKNNVAYKSLLSVSCHMRHRWKDGWMKTPLLRAHAVSCDMYGCKSPRIYLQKNLQSATAAVEQWGLPLERKCVGQLRPPSYDCQLHGWYTARSRGCLARHILYLRRCTSPHSHQLVKFSQGLITLCN